MRLYLAGPMTGIPLWNFPRFAEVTQELRLLGHKVISPAEIDQALGFDPDDYPNLPYWWTFDEAIALDLAAIDRSEAIALLEGWENSVGCKIEYEHAIATDKEIYEWADVQLVTHKPSE